MNNARQSIGILGGSFDPVHNGHYAIAKSFVNSELVSELWILLTPDPPHKPHKELSDYNIRLKMLRTAFGDLDHIAIKDLEKDLPKPSYTVRTIKFLKEKYPEKDFYLCIGEDSLAQFKEWYNWREILENCELLVAHRPSNDVKNIDDIVLKKTHFISHNPVKVSSTEVRQRVLKGQSISGLVPQGVERLIKKYNLYKNY